MSVLLSHGMVVHLSEHIKGLVPRTHLSDIILKNPEKKYMEGMKIKCRVCSLLYFEKPRETRSVHIWLSGLGYLQIFLSVNGFVYVCVCLCTGTISRAGE